MVLKESLTKEEMLQNFEILQEMYPSLTCEQYSTELDFMLTNNYGQVGIYDGAVCAGLTGFWFGSKLWCGRYLELDNVIISKNYRRQGIGERLFQYMEEKAKKLECTMLALDSYTDNFEAHKFFYAQKFVPRGFHFIHVLDKSKVR